MNRKINLHFNKKQIRILKIISILFGLGLIGIFLVNSDLSLITDQLYAINWKIIFIILSTGISYALATLAWKFCFSENNRIGFFRLFFIRLAGESLAQINPTNIVAGETLKIFQLRKNGVSNNDSIHSTALSRIIIVLSGFHLILIWGIIYFQYFKILDRTAEVILLVLSFCGIIGFTIFLFKHKKNVSSGIFQNVKFLDRIRLIKYVKDKLNLLSISISDFYKNNKIKYFSAYLLSFFHRITGAFEFYFILQFLNINISFTDCIGIEIGVMIFKAAGVFIPGQIGIEELGNKVMLTLTNISEPSLWITVSVIKRIRQMLWIAVGLISFIIISKFALTKNTDKDYDDGSVVYNS